MQLFSLDFEDFENEDYLLLGIHTVLDDYKIAYLLNKNLKITLSKSDSLEILIENKKNYFSLFTYSNENNWFLIKNSFIEDNIIQSKKLLLSTERKIYLIPEKKQIDFFLKITGDVNNKDKIKIIECIKKTPQVITSYTIDKNKLKSKDFLIF